MPTEIIFKSPPQGKTVEKLADLTEGPAFIEFSPKVITHVSVGPKSKYPTLKMEIVETRGECYLRPLEPPWGWGGDRET